MGSQVRQLVDDLKALKRQHRAQRPAGRSVTPLDAAKRWNVGAPAFTPKERYVYRRTTTNPRVVSPDDMPAHDQMKPATRPVATTDGETSRDNDDQNAQETGGDSDDDADGDGDDDGGGGGALHGTMKKSLQ
ncbi:hypothetical protein DFQ27_009274 [Actinomortierella ambigua]|uniref:Uncharacterized protein n=1 Tax=Actinomortierella ambigua TaxID=1343610 RepID=A0A9P6PNI6_9FUNG|nr:hypothetical protein DFQ27_009274 [Actinomortierella ambigua]